MQTILKKKNIGLRELSINPTITNRHAQEFINSHLTEKHEKQKDNNTIQPFIPATSETAIETNS